MSLGRDASQQRRSLLADRDGFQRLPEGGLSGKDTTVNIPLGTVPANANEKAGFFKRKGDKKSRPETQRRQSREHHHEFNVMGKIYNRIFNFSIVTRYLLLSFPLGALIAVPIVLGATVLQGDNADGVPIVWVFTWVEAVWLALWTSKIFAKVLPYIFEFVVGAVSPGVKKYSLAIRRLEIPISLVGWALASLATFVPILQHHPPPVNLCPVNNGTLVECGSTGSGSQSTDLPAWVSTVQNVLTAILISTLILLAEKMFVQFVSINYHAMQYERRIKDSKHQIYLLGLLYEASSALFEPFCPEFQEEDYIINDSINLPLRSKHASRGGSGHATPLRVLQNVGRLGDQITAAFGRVAHEVTGKDVFNPTAAHSVVLEALEKKVSCEALARRIWMSLVVEGKDALYLEDVQEVLAERPPEDAIQAFEVVDRDGNGDVSLDEMILTICEIGRERKAVANSLHNIGSAINVLDNLLLLIVAVAVVFVFVAFLNSSFNTTLATAGASLLSVSFIFSSTAAEILGSCIFLFVKHPYDVDDRVDINSEQLVVERISLLYTVFRNITTHTTTQAPNSVLNSLWINNITRSKAMREQLLIYISFDTTLEDVELLRREMQQFVLEKENCRDFEPEINVEVTSLESMDKMELNIEIKHKSNWANETVRAARRSKFMCALVLALRKVPIYAPGGGGAALGSADQPTYSVSVSNAEATAARKAFADAKAASHIKNTATTPGGGGVSTGVSPYPDQNGTLQQRGGPPPVKDESSALALLNLRDPSSDPSRDGVQQPSSGAPGSPAVDQTDSLLRRQSTRGKRQSPGYGTQRQSVYLNPPPPVATGRVPPSQQPKQPQQPRAATRPPQQQEGLPNYNSFPVPPRSAGSGGSAPRAPRYDMPPGGPPQLPRIQSPPQDQQDQQRMGAAALAEYEEKFELQ